MYKNFSELSSGDYFWASINDKPQLLRKIAYHDDEQPQYYRWGLHESIQENTFEFLQHIPIPKLSGHGDSKYGIFI